MGLNLEVKIFGMVRSTRMSKVLEKFIGRAKAWLFRWGANYKTNILYQDLQIPTESKRKPTLCVFAHFSSSLKIDRSVLHLVSALCHADCDVIFVSSSGKGFEIAEFDKLKDVAIGKILRQNFGYDFGSWKAAVDVYPEMSSDYERIVFANDSVFGPFSDLKKILQGISCRNYDVWSLTDSYERGYHLQSFFWGVESKGLNGGFFEYFWNEYFRYCSNREEAIKQYELSFCAIAKQLFGLRVGAYFGISVLEAKYCVVAHNNISKCNPVQHLAYALLNNEGFPFVKRELLLRNPMGVRELADIKESCQRINPELWAFVNQELFRHSLGRGE